MKSNHQRGGSTTNQYWINYGGLVSPVVGECRSYTKERWLVVCMHIIHILTKAYSKELFSCCT